MAWSYIPELDAFTIYHQIKGRSLSGNEAAFLAALGHALAGATGTAMSNLLVYPLDLVVTRLQVQGRGNRPEESARNNSLQDTVGQIYVHEGGMRAFYSGVQQDTVKSVCDSFLFFGAYNLLWRVRTRRGSSSGTLASRLVDDVLLGMIAGAATKAVTSPLQQIITRKQTAAMKFEENSKSEMNSSDARKLSTQDIAKHIYKTRGYQGFWAGYSASIILTLNPSLTMAVDSLLRALVSARTGINAAWTFLLAAVGKAAASSITYPVSLAKARSQVHSAQPGSSNGRKLSAGPIGVLLMISAIARNEGPGSLYAGLGGEVLKGFLSHGLTMLVKQRIHSRVIQLYFALIRLVRQQRGTRPPLK